MRTGFSRSRLRIGCAGYQGSMTWCCVAWFFGLWFEIGQRPGRGAWRRTKRQIKSRRKLARARAACHARQCLFLPRWRKTPNMGRFFPAQFRTEALGCVASLERGQGGDDFLARLLERAPCCARATGDLDEMPADVRADQRGFRLRKGEYGGGKIGGDPRGFGSAQGAALWFSGLI